MIQKIINTEKIKSSLVSAAGQLLYVSKSPDEGLGDLFNDVQKQHIFSDGKTFVDLIPRRRMKQLKQEYTLAKKDPTFNLQEFIARYFYEMPLSKKDPYVASDHLTASEHISGLWSHLERRNRRDRGSLIALPYTYVVPGGRFDEQFYWDSYFIMLGLAADNRWDIVEGMLKNVAYLIRKFGFIPTANRTYFLSRSQPPFFSHMVRLVAKHKGKSVLVEYLPYLIQEYRFWMKGTTKLAKRDSKSFARVVQMKNGVVLNRYYDNKTTPRPESLREDVEVAAERSGKEAGELYLHIRAAAESGWDFSSRWFAAPQDIKTIQTVDIIPVDLNALLYQLEVTISEAYQVLKQPLLMRKFHKLADLRAKAINTYCWDEDQAFYKDFNFQQDKYTHSTSLAGVFPLYARIASSKQAAGVAKMIEKQFLQPGGLLTTTVDTDQQWDGKNGWAPLHLVVIEGLRNYGYHDLANTIKRRWVKTNMKVYQAKHKMVEKYDVRSSGIGGGGEYPLQDGFGWTNGVLKVLLSEDKH